MLLKPRTARHKGAVCPACGSVVALVEAVAPRGVIRWITSYPGVIHLPMLPLRETTRERGEGCER
jgi:hypothetical protein